MSAEEQLARMVHSVAAFGGTADDVLRTANHSAAVILHAMTYIDPDEEIGTVPWPQVLAALSEALGRVR